MHIYFNLELDSHINKKGEKLVLLRCTQDRKHKRLSTGIYINPIYWDNKSKLVTKKHPLYKEYNTSIKEMNLKIEKSYIDMIKEDPDITVESFIQHFKQPKSVNFFEFAYQQKLNQFKAKKKFGTFRRYEAVLNKLKAFAGVNLTFNRVNYRLLKEYEFHCLTVLNNSRDTISSNLSVLRSIIKEAIKHELYKGRNPFEVLKLKYTDNTKNKLTIEELRKLEQVNLPDTPSLHLAKDFFMACFYAAGCRAGDMVMMKWENIQDSNIVYIQQKTGKKLVLPVLSQLQDIFTRYRSNSPYIFPLLKDDDKEINEMVVNSRITYINKYLKEVCKYAGIFKKISTHCARHTFSDISLFLSNNDVYGLRDVLGHSSVKTTEGYLRDRNYVNTVKYLSNISNLLSTKEI